MEPAIFVMHRPRVRKAAVCADEAESYVDLGLFSFRLGCVLVPIQVTVWATPHDEAHGVFKTPSPYTRTREDDGQPVESEAMRQPTQQMLSRRII